MRDADEPPWTFIGQRRRQLREVVGQRGSHVKLRKGKRGTIVPVHGNESLKRGLLRAIEKQTGEKIL
jgi:hypothetical protein